MSYFDYFFLNIKKETTADNVCIKGTCCSMCPQVEIKLREKEKMVHVLEVIGTDRKLVKSYSRSAADSNMAIPHLLRPYSVLKDTLQHLLLVVLRRTDVPTCIVYDFIDDRLRAIRQDMTIQRLPPHECACLLEPMIKFYVYFGYKLSDASHNDFNAVLNKKYLMECLKWFLHCCDTIEKPKNEDIADLSTFISMLDINKEKTHMNKQVKSEADRILMESFYILSNLDDMHPLIRYLSIPKRLKSDQSSVLQLSYNIAMANLKGDYITFCRLINKLCPLAYSTAWLYLPELQRKSLKVMSYAYSSKILMVPSEVIQGWLCFSSKHEVMEVCRHYGLAIQDNQVRFNKNDFRKDVPLHTLRKDVLCDEKLSIEKIFHL